MTSKECKEQIHNLILVAKTAVQDENASRIAKSFLDLHHALQLSEQLIGMGLDDVFEIMATAERRHSAGTQPWNPEIIASVVEVVSDIRDEHLHLMRDLLAQLLDAVGQCIDQCSSFGLSEMWRDFDFPNPLISYPTAVHASLMHLILQQKHHISKAHANINVEKLEQQISYKISETPSPINPDELNDCMAYLGILYNFVPQFQIFKTAGEAIAFIKTQKEQGSPVMTQIQSRLGHLHWVTVLDIEIEREVGFLTTADEIKIPMKQFAWMLHNTPTSNTVWSILPPKDETMSISNLKLPPRIPRLQ